MSTFKISLIQSKIYNSYEEIKEKIEIQIREAHDLYHPSIIVLPEFWIGKYNKEEFLKLAQYEEDSLYLSFLSSLSKELDVYIIGGSIPELVKTKEKSYTNKEYTVYNTCFCFDRSGKIKAKYRKTHLFDVSIKNGITFKESDKFSYGQKLTVFKTEFCNIGIGICYDIRFPEMTKAYKEIYNCDVMIFPSNFSKYTGSLHWDLLMKSRAVDYNCFFIKCCPSRNYETPSSYQSYGSSQVVSPYGRVISSCSYEVGVVNSEIDLGLVRIREKEVPLYEGRRDDMYKLILKE